MKHSIIILALFLMALCAFFATLFLQAFYGKKFKNALVFKGLASLCFVTLGAVSFFSSELSLPKLFIFAGLCWGIVGDEIIALCQIFPRHDEKTFLGGGACFIVGHILYMIAMLILGNINYIAVAVAFVIIVLLCAIYENSRKYLANKLKGSLKLYIAVVVFTTAIAVGAFLRQGTVGTALFAVGGALFTVSDNILFAFKFGMRPRYRQNVALHIAYYAAQFVIALSMACI